MANVPICAELTGEIDLSCIRSLVKKYFQEVVVINFNDIDEKEEYKKIIYQVINKCFEVENLKETKLYINIIF